MDFPIADVRRRFPALAVTDDGRPRIHFDAPGGTQVCRHAIEAMGRQQAEGTANAGGAFATSQGVDALAADARRAVADLLAAEPDELAFGPNMTTLTLAASRALARDWRSGDEVVVTRLDHDANVAPWLEAAEDRGVAVRWLDFDPADGRLRLDELPGLLSPRTRLVAVGGASNALGTLNDLSAIVAAVRAGSDALVFVDAVQLAPHLAIDVRALGCDLLAFSPYKMFGPHAGVLWVRRALADTLRAYKVRPAGAVGARRFETGTPSFEALAGVLGMVDHLDWLGGVVAPGAADRRGRLVAAFEAATAHETVLGQRLLDGLARFDGVRLYGPPGMADRVPTFGFTVRDHDPRTVAAHLARHGICAWAGHFYAVETIARLGLAEVGGLVRVGFCHYHRVEEVDRLLETVAALT